VRVQIDPQNGVADTVENHHRKRKLHVMEIAIADRTFGSARGKRMPWKTFLPRAPTLAPSPQRASSRSRCPPLIGLVRYLVPFVIDLETRRVQNGGTVRQPYGAWMTQVARNLTDDVDGF
jgi:hypothetical protein